MRGLEPAPQICRADALLAITQLDHVCQQLVQDLALSLRGHLDPQLSQVVGEGRSARELAQGVLAPSGKALRCKLGAVQGRLGVAVCVDACRLCEDAGTEERGIVCHTSSAGGGHPLAQLIQVRLVYTGVHAGVIPQSHHHLGQTGIASALTQTIDRHV